VPAGKPESGFAAVNALNQCESGEAPDIFYATRGVEARKNVGMKASFTGVVKLLPGAASRGVKVAG